MWPNGSRFALCLTHDVDRVRKTYQYLTHFIKTRRLYHLRSLWDRVTRGVEPYWNFERIMELERGLGVRSTFFFLHETKRPGLDPRTWPRSIGYYDPREPRVAEVIRRLAEGGWEIALHGSHDSYLRPDLLAREKRELEGVLGDEVLGVRQHYLNLEIPRTWEIQAGLGFLYDSTLALKRGVGFPRGRYRPFLPLPGRRFIEVPVTVMDINLFREARGDPGTALKIINKIYDEAEERGALVTLIWHQRVFNEEEFPGWSEVYRRAVLEARRRGAWIARAVDVARWCLGE